MVKISTKTFTLLSIGHRTVGKTVFLAGSYAELHSHNQPDSSQQLWFDCQDTQVQENIEHILSYIVKTDEYPPPTIKVTNFDFSLKLKAHSLSNIKTLCHFCWRDIPGEYCNLRNLEFQEMAFSSHGCCVFIDAYALVHSKAYLQMFENIIKQVMAIANLFCLNGSKYAFALILTKCDLLEPSLLNQQELTAGLQLLTTRLDAVKANYETFYSFIPINCTEDASSLKPKGAAAPFLWLTWELNKAHNPSMMKNLIEFVTPLLPTRLQPQPAIIEQVLQSQIKAGGKALSNKILSSLLRLASWKYILLLALVMVSLLGVLSTFLVKEAVANYEQDHRSNTRYLDAAKQIVPLVEQRVQEAPENFGLRLQLAQLYERTKQFSKAEIAYDQVIAQKNDNLNALLGKANLRCLKGDKQAAKLLFVQAEKAAPPHLKARIRALAQETLQLPAKLNTTHAAS